MSAGSPPIVALVDHSAYAPSVALHAAWLAERMQLGLELVHCLEGRAEDAATGRGLLADLASQLTDQGLAPPQRHLVDGTLARMVVTRAASGFVMGKRGADSQDDRQVLGAQVDAVLEATALPVCLASQVFLPIARALVVTDADPERRAALDLVASHRRLAALQVEVLVAAPPSEVVEDKLALARMALGTRAKVFAMDAERPGEAVWGYLATRQTDLIVISRAVLLAHGHGPLREIAPAGLWNARTPVLVC